MSYFLACITSKYVQFDGRARRAEFWYFILFVIILHIVVRLIDIFVLGFRMDPADPMHQPLLGSIVALLLLLPSIAVAIRRLHDTDRSGWWYLLVFVPVIGWIALIVFYATRGTPGANRFGPDPIAQGQ